MRASARCGRALQAAAGVGDGHEVGGDALGRHGFGEMVDYGIEHAAHLDGAARFARYQHEGFLQVDACENRAHAHGRHGVEHFEIDGVAVDLVVFGDGHRRLGRAALADQQHRFDTIGDGFGRECLDFLAGIWRVRSQIGPSHEISRAFAGAFVERIERVVFGVDAAGNLVAHQGFRSGIKLLGFAGKHGHLFLENDRQ